MKNIFGETVKKPATPRKSSPKKSTVLGCEACPLDKVPGVNKLINIDRIRGRKIFVWAQSPGETENAQGFELIGKAGQFLWDELKLLGIERKDCDVQNVVRCIPITSEDRNTPTKLELRCCSVFNPQAIEKNGGHAVVHLILGKIAGHQLLGPLYGKVKAALWYEPWNAYIVLADHPSKVLRQGGRRAGWVYYAFRDKLHAAKEILDHPGRWGFVRAQDYAAVTTPEEMEELKNEITTEAKAGRRVSVDIEDGLVNGKKKLLLIGFGWGQAIKKGESLHNWKGKARSVVLFHPGASQKKSRIQPLLDSLYAILTDPQIKKVLQHGSYDVIQLRKSIKGLIVNGYDFDTQYASYLRHPHLRTYGLDSLAGYFFPEFADYKQMVSEWMPDNLAACPLDVLVTYNCGDADLTKRIEVKMASVNLPLLRVYVNAAFTLGEMEQHGPLLDREAHARLLEVVSRREETLRRQLQQTASDPEFNPNTPQQVAKLLFDKLGLPQINRRSTGKEVLEALSAQTKSKVPQLVSDYRAYSKMKGTYLVGYKKSADMHDGELRTIWWLTGAVTGRLRSGKSDKAEQEEGVINMQNLHSSPLLQNCIVSDVNWKIALED